MYLMSFVFTNQQLNVKLLAEEIYSTILLTTGPSGKVGGVYHLVKHCVVTVTHTLYFTSPI